MFLIKALENYTYEGNEISINAKKILILYSITKSKIIMI